MEILKKNQLIHMIIREGTSSNFQIRCLPLPTTPVPFISGKFINCKHLGLNLFLRISSSDLDQLIKKLFSHF